MFFKNLIKKLPIKRIFFFNSEYIFQIHFNFIYLISFFFQKHQLLQFKILNFITSCDFLNLYNRFELNYEFLSIKFNQKIRIKFLIKDIQKVLSIVNLFKNSDWFEREIWDMFGIYFKNNFNLRRLLTDYGFSYFPLRKNFPLTGYYDLFYDTVNKQILYKLNFLYQIKNKKKINLNWSNLF